mgnify:CR=1 FL=1|tara:strand:+ start:9196 stop:9582 length:387 start_codon:yes stop_codon:yes gene_type:complete
MKLTKEQVEVINEECPYGQGVFREPFGIPNNIKGLVVYTKWVSGGRSGSCFDDENTQNEDYKNDRPSDCFEVLDRVLKILKPEIAYLDFGKIEALTKSNQETNYGYYGDYTEDVIEWIELEDLIDVLK